MSNTGGTGFYVPLAFAATLLVVVACGPQRDYVPVRRVPSTRAVEAIQQCSQNLAGAKRPRVDERRTLLRVCELSQPEVQAVNPDGSTPFEVPPEPKGEGRSPALPSAESTGDDAKEAPVVTPPVPAWIEQPVRFTLDREQDALAVVIKLGISLPSEFTEPTKKLFGVVMFRQCLPKIREVFARSGQNESRLTLSIEAYDMSLKENERVAFDQILRFQSADPQGPEALRVLQMANRPQAARMFVWSSSGAMPELCAKQPYDCVSAEQNEPFCRSLAQSVGQWVGLAPQGAMTQTCGALPEASPTASPGAKPRVVRKSSTDKPMQIPFMKALSESTSKEFWNTAKLSDEDVLTILGPACNLPKPSREEATPTDRRGTPPPGVRMRN